MHSRDRLQKCGTRFNWKLIPYGEEFAKDHTAFSHHKSFNMAITDSSLKASVYSDILPYTLSNFYTQLLCMLIWNLNASKGWIPRNIQATPKFWAPHGWHEASTILRTHSLEWPVIHAIWRLALSARQLGTWRIFLHVKEKIAVILLKTDGVSEQNFVAPMCQLLTPFSSHQII